MRAPAGRDPGRRAEAAGRRPVRGRRPHGHTPGATTATTTPSARTSAAISAAGARRRGARTADRGAVASSPPLRGGRTAVAARRTAVAWAARGTGALSVVIARCASSSWSGTGRQVPRRDSGPHAAVLDTSKTDRVRCCAVRPSSDRSAGSPSSAVSAVARAGGSSGGTRQWGRCPGGRLSLAPATSVSRTGTPQAMASRGASAIPSQREGRTRRSAAWIQGRTSAVAPANSTSAGAERRSSSPYGPSPTRTSRAPGAAVVRQARSSTSWPFCLLSRPTHTASGTSAGTPSRRGGRPGQPPARPHRRGGSGRGRCRCGSPTSVP